MQHSPPQNGTLFFMLSEREDSSRISRRIIAKRWLSSSSFGAVKTFLPRLSHFIAPSARHGNA